MVYKPFTPTTSFGYNPSPPAAPGVPEKKPAKKKPKVPPAPSDARRDRSPGLT